MAPVLYPDGDRFEIVLLHEDNVGPTVAVFVRETDARRAMDLWAGSEDDSGEKALAGMRAAIRAAGIPAEFPDRTDP